MIEDLKNILSKKDFKYLIILFFGMLISAAIEMLGLSSVPIFIMVIIDSNALINQFPHFFDNEFIKNLDQNYLTIYGGIILIAIFLFKNLYLSMFLFFQGKVLKIIRTRITNELFNKYLRASYSFHISNNPASLTRSITSSVMGTINSVTSLLSIARETMVLIVVFILLFLNEPLVSVNVFLTLVTFVGLFLLLTRKELLSRGAQVEIEKEKQLKTINHALDSIRETKILNRESYLSNLFKIQVNKIEKHTFFMYFLNQTPKLFLEFTAVLAVSMMAIIFVIIEFDKERILPIISLLAVCSLRLIPAFNVIVSSMSTRRFSSASLKIISAAFKDIPFDEIPNNRIIDYQKTNTNEEVFKTNLKFKNVFFNHKNSNIKILENISLEINQGQKIGIIGKSGAGKSTLIDLVLGLIKPVNGTIYLDNKDLQFTLKKWQALIGYVPQDIYLSDDTIRNNIAFGLNENDIKDNLIENSIKLAKLDEFIGSLEKGANTIVGNRGIRLSGGQKQRIGIARALYNNPKVLILDEATSSLDFSTEKKIMDEVFKASTNKTLLVITHRHNSVFNCDKVFLIDKGKIIDSGKYDELKNK